MLCCTGTGKGGQSIWGGKFEDEFHDSLKVCSRWTSTAPSSMSTLVYAHPVQHTGRGVVSMANSGADSNGSQFFITYSRQAHLDTKYTVFGRYAGLAPCCACAPLVTTHTSPMHVQL